MKEILNERKHVEKILKKGEIESNKRVLTIKDRIVIKIFKKHLKKYIIILELK